MKIGDRIRLIKMSDDPDPILEGTEGTILRIDFFNSVGPKTYMDIDVDWDNGRTLGLIIPPDVVEVIPS